MGANSITSPSICTRIRPFLGSWPVMNARTRSNVTNPAVTISVVMDGDPSSSYLNCIPCGSGTPTLSSNTKLTVCVSSPGSTAAPGSASQMIALSDIQDVVIHAVPAIETIAESGRKTPKLAPLNVTRPAPTGHVRPANDGIVLGLTDLISGRSYVNETEHRNLCASEPGEITDVTVTGR
eukprot:2158034-Rhodomonas_salina.2